MWGYLSTQCSRFLLESTLFQANEYSLEPHVKHKSDERLVCRPQTQQLNRSAGELAVENNSSVALEICDISFKALHNWFDP